MTKLLRVEWNGLGMHRPQKEDINGESISLFIAAGCEESYQDHPMPSDDFHLVRFWNYRTEFQFAFGTSRQFLRWVYQPQWRHKMVELGGVLLVIEVEEDFYIGEKQAVYNKDKVISVKQFPVNSFDIPKLKKKLEKYLTK